jgi:hypothetical protein
MMNMRAVISFEERLSDIEIATRLCDAEIVKDTNIGLSFGTLQGLAWQILLEIYIAAMNDQIIQTAELRSSENRPSRDTVDSLIHLETQGYIIRNGFELCLSSLGRNTVQDRIKAVMDIEHYPDR